jgi:hypothetical protein
VFSALRSLDADGRLLFATRFVRLFAYGGLSVVLVLYLVGLGPSEADTAVLANVRLMLIPLMPTLPLAWCFCYV